ncbi:MAG: hypothetical protein QXG00_04170 [Candidatus Woesearchaeota archaeon]
MFDGAVLLSILIIVLPICGIIIKLLDAFSEREAIKEILGEEKFNWLIEQHQNNKKNSKNVSSFRVFYQKVFADKIYFLFHNTVKITRNISFVILDFVKNK